MAGVFHLAYLFIEIVLLAWMIMLSRQSASWSWSAVLIIAMLGFLVYENLVLALGSVLSAGPLLFALSMPRYFSHAVFSPFFVFIVIDQARQAGVEWTLSRTARMATWMIIGALIAFGLFEFAHFEFVPLAVHGYVRYVPEEAGPSASGIAITIAALITGSAIWRARGWPWMALAALVVLLGSGAAAPLGSENLSLITNGLEVILLISLILFESYLRVGAMAPFATAESSRRQGG